MTKKIYPGWWQLAVAMLTQAVCGGSIFSAYSVVAAPLKVEFAPSNMVLMLGMTVTSLASGLLSPSLGAALDRFSIRKLMLLGIALVVSGFWLLSVSTSMIQVLAIYAVCMAVGSTLLGPIATSALLARWFTRKRALAMGIAASGSAIGGLLFPPLLQGLIDGLEWRMALRVFGAVVFVVAVPLIAWLVIDRPTQAAATDSDGGNTAKPQPAPLLSTREVLRDPNFWMISLIIGALFSGPIAIISNMIQLMGEKGLSATQGAFLISIFSGANFAGKLIFAGVADRLDKHLVLTVTLLGIGLGVVGLLHSYSFTPLATFCFVIGLFAGFTTPLWSVILSQIYGAACLGKMMGLMSLFIMPFTLVSPPLFGWVYDISGSYGNALLGYTVFLALTLALTRWVGRGSTQGTTQVSTQITPGETPNEAGT